MDQWSFLYLNKTNIATIFLKIKTPLSKQSLQLTKIIFYLTESYCNIFGTLKSSLSLNLISVILKTLGASFVTTTNVPQTTTTTKIERQVLSS